MLHPAILMNSKRKIVVPSLLTKPRGRKKFSFKVGPPRLFTDHWYFQADFYKLPLLTLSATACCLRFPFCSPQTNNICISFQVLKPCYNKYLSINAFDNDTTDQKLKDFLNEAFKISTAGTTYRAFNQLNTFKTEGGISHPQLHKPVPDENKPSSGDYFAKRDALWGDAIYCNTRADQDTGAKIIEKFLIPNMTSYFKKIAIRKLTTT